MPYFEYFCQKVQLITRPPAFSYGLPRLVWEWNCLRCRGKFGWSLSQFLLAVYTLALSFYLFANALWAVISLHAVKISYFWSPYCAYEFSWLASVSCSRLKRDKMKDLIEPLYACLWLHRTAITTINSNVECAAFKLVCREKNKMLSKSA